MTKIKHLYRKFFWSELKDFGCCVIFLVIVIVLLLTCQFVYELHDKKPTDIHELIVDDLES